MPDTPEDVVKEARIKELESQFTNFRTRVINLCKEKAAEWERRSKAHDYFTNAELSDYRSKRQAANELREAIENLDHQGE